MTAHTLLIRDLLTGRYLGAALVAIDARYLSVLPTGADRIDRRFVAPAAWAVLAHELQTLTSGPIESTSTLARVVLGGRAQFTIETIAAVPVDDTPIGLVERLDALLKTHEPQERTREIRQERS